VVFFKFFYADLTQFFLKRERKSREKNRFQAVKKKMSAGLAQRTQKRFKFHNIIVGQSLTKKKKPVYADLSQFFLERERKSREKKPVSNC
jgi:hypothetical protein